jgi:hypothetical protein
VVLERKIPAAGPPSILGVVLKHSKEVGDLEQVVRTGEDPGAKDAQKTLPLVGEHANRETSGIEVSSHELTLVVV